MVREPLARVSQGSPHRSQPAEKRGRSRLIGLTKGGRNSKLHAVCDSRGRPVQMFLSAGETSDCTGAAGLLSVMPQAKVLLADRGYRAGASPSARDRWRGPTGFVMH